MYYGNHNDDDDDGDDDDDNDDDDDIDGKCSHPTAWYLSAPGMRLLPVEAEPELPGVVAYTLGVLDAIGIEHGCMHSEIKLEERGPVLVEVLTLN